MLEILMILKIFVQDEEIIDLDALTNNDPDATIGGIFSGTGVTDNEFDPSVGAGTYTITYAVDDSPPCTTEAIQPLI